MTPSFCTRTDRTDFFSKINVDLALDQEQIKATQEKQNSKKAEFSKVTGASIVWSLTCDFAFYDIKHFFMFLSSFFVTCR